MYLQEGSMVGPNQYITAKEGDMDKGASGGPWLAIDENGIYHVAGIQSMMDKVNNVAFSPEFSGDVLDFVSKYFG